MQTTLTREVGKKVRDKKIIALRVTDDKLDGRIRKLAEEQGLSLNMTVNLLLGYAFNRVDEENKKFVSKTLFETE